MNCCKRWRTCYHARRLQATRCLQLPLRYPPKAVWLPTVDIYFLHAFSLDGYSRGYRASSARAKIDIIQVAAIHASSCWNVIFRWTLPSSSSGKVQQRSSLNCPWKPILTWLVMLLDVEHLRGRAALYTMRNWIAVEMHRAMLCSQLHITSRRTVAKSVCDWYALISAQKWNRDIFIKYIYVHRKEKMKSDN